MVDGRSWSIAAVTPRPHKSLNLRGGHHSCEYPAAIEDARQRSNCRYLGNGSEQSGNVRWGMIGWIMVGAACSTSSWSDTPTCALRASACTRCSLSPEVSECQRCRRCREVSRRCRGGVEAVSIDTGVNGVEACRPCRLSVGGRIDSLYAWHVSECRLCRVSECRACRSVSERVEGVECVNVSSAHQDITTVVVSVVVVGWPWLGLGWPPLASVSLSLSLLMDCAIGPVMDPAIGRADRRVDRVPPHIKRHH